MREALRPRSFVMLLLALAAASAVLLGGSAESASATSTVTYTQQQTQPIPPAQNYAGSAGGDGYTVALYNGRVYNVFHHLAHLTVACHAQLDASSCPNSPETITDTSGNNFATSRQEDIFVDQSTGKLWVYATRTSDHTAGVVCVDTTIADTNSNPFCGFVPLSATGEAALAPISPFEALFGSPLQVGSRLYAFNYVPKAGASAGANGTENTILCFDLSTQAACSGQPYAVSLGAGTTDSLRPPPEDATIGTQLVIPMSMSGAAELACFDTSTQGNCSGSWPVATPTIPIESYGAPFPLLDAAGNTTGFCLPDGTEECFTLTGASTAAPPGLAGAIGQTRFTNGPAVVLGPRVYVPNWNTTTVGCYDYSQSASCTNFPLALANVGGLYTVNPDPQRPSCIWTNGDNGSWQIQNFDAYSGGPCTQKRVLASQFVVASEPQCFPTSYTSLQILTPTPDQYGGGSVSFADGDGSPIAGLSSVSLDATGTADLTGLNLNTPTGLPQFLITLNNGDISNVPLTVKLTWTGPDDPVCASGGQTIVPETATTSLDANLNDGTNTSKNLTEWVGTPVTNIATLSGTNAAGATGTVTYHWWTDSSCTTQAAPDDTETITTPGTLPASQPVNLPVGVYYETVDYSGDTLNDASSTSCGSETLTVKNVPTITTYTGPTRGTSGASTTATANLIAQPTSTPLGGKLVTITVGSLSCTGTTDAAGNVSCVIVMKLPNGAYPVTASFAGSGYYLASSGPGVFTMGPFGEGNSTIGFWKGPNGQKILTGGAATAGTCNSGTWLRNYAPFQDLGSSASCATVASYVTGVLKDASGSNMGTMLKAQMLAAALDLYFSSPSFGGSQIGSSWSYGYNTYSLINVQPDGNASAAFGGATSATLAKLLAYASSQSNVGGSTWYSNAKSAQTLAKDVFADITTGMLALQ